MARVTHLLSPTLSVMSQSGCLALEPEPELVTEVETKGTWQDTGGELPGTPAHPDLLSRFSKNILLQDGLLWCQAPILLLTAL